ncbi:hypothetical protein, conserved [Plasmodium gonderi]|uniref:Uncharacterized protein n=1 Tax=Plasmodium gonderi TaxID=77519 RepID=A0A1Y1JCN2_PLAGO|nr:hypothetical protein, conserved [Plasmodium gonderi]GAW79438.1 hypothetical protein, conserved [Plasmodium gonderi]
MQLHGKCTSKGVSKFLGRQKNKESLRAINEYREKLKCLSNHEKVVRIDLNRRGEKCSRYFFDNNKYIYVKNNVEIEQFDRGERCIGERHNNVVISSTIRKMDPTSSSNVKERKLLKSAKKLRDMYDLLQEEFVYMKFIYKIKIKNIFALVNNIKKNKHIDKKQRDIILNCIYKYVSHNCYVMCKNDFFFFLYIFPQKLKYSTKVIHYLRNFLEKELMTLSECLRLINEINLLHINYHIRYSYIHFLIRNIHKITVGQMLHMLTTGSYLFAITPDFKTNEEKQDVTFKNLLIKNVKERKNIPLDEKLKNEYLNFLTMCASCKNVYLKIFFNDLYVQLHKRIIIENLNVIKQNNDYEYLQKVVHLGSCNICINHLNYLLLPEEFFFPKNSNKKKIKIKVFPSFIDMNQVDILNTHHPMEEKEDKKCSESSLENLQDTFSPNGVSSEQSAPFVTNINELTLPDSRCTSKGRKSTNKHSHYKFVEDKNMTVTDSYSLLTPPKIADSDKHNQMNKKKLTNYYDDLGKTSYHQFNYKKGLTEESTTFQNMKKAFAFSTPYDKLRNIQYEELKQKYKINTKVVDKNVKIFLKFLKISHNFSMPSSSTLDKAFERESLSTIISGLCKWNTKGRNKLDIPKGFRDEKGIYMKYQHIHHSEFTQNSPLWKFTNWWYQNQAWNHKLGNTFFDLLKNSEKAGKMSDMFAHTACSLVPCGIIKSVEVTNPFETKREQKQGKFSLQVGHPLNTNDEVKLTNLFHSPCEKERNKNIQSLVSNIYFSPYYNKKYFHKSQINSLAKCLLYLSNSYLQYSEHVHNYNKKIDIHLEKIFLQQVEKTFYEIFTYVIKNMYLVNLSNWFYIFLSFCKFVSLPQGRGGINGQVVSGISLEKVKHPLMENMLSVISSVETYRYEEVRSILEDEDNRRYLHISQCGIKQLVGEELTTQLSAAHVGGGGSNYETLHRIILRNFNIGGRGSISLPREWALEGAENGESENSAKNGESEKSEKSEKNGESEKSEKSEKNGESEKSEKSAENASINASTADVAKVVNSTRVASPQTGDEESGVRASNRGGGIENLKGNVPNGHTNQMMVYQSGIKFLLTMLNNYLIFSPFHMKRFLIILYHLNMQVFKNITSHSHFETRLYQNYNKFMNRYFYIHTGCKENVEILKKSHVAKLKWSYLMHKKEKHLSCTRYNLCARTQDDLLGDRHTYDVYSQVENIFRKKKKFFTLDDLINFIVIYSLNGFYHYSTFYYDISKWLFRYDLSCLKDEMKIFLYLHLSHCKHVYKPLYFYLLRQVCEIKTTSKQINLLLLCNFIYMLINYDDHGQVKLKNVPYIQRKFGKILWTYFFPIDLFVIKNAHIIASTKIKNFEYDIASTKSIDTGPNDKKTTMHEKMNLAQIHFDFNIWKIKDHLKSKIPQMVTLLEEEYLQKKTSSKTERHDHPFLLFNFHIFDKKTEEEMFNICLNFLSYDFVCTNFLISKKSLYYAMLLHLKREQKVF